MLRDGVRRHCRMLPYKRHGIRRGQGISDGDSSEDEREDEFRNNIVSASASLGEILTGILTSGEVC